MKKTKVIFMGTPAFSTSVLKGLIENYEVVLVVTQPDKEVGRKKELAFSPVKRLAIENIIPVFQPIKIREDYERVLNTPCDIIITCAYGQIIPKNILDYPPLGCINVHASLLPSLRGGAPIQRALIEGYEKTGITIMYMDEGMDSGDIISKEEYIIKETDTFGSLHDVLSNMGGELLLKTMSSIIKGTNKRIKQNAEGVTFAPNIKRADEHLDFNNNCTNIYNRVRGLNPYPYANIIIDKEELKVVECYYEIVNHHKTVGTIIEVKKDCLGVSAKDGIIYITKIKPFGKGEMLVKDYLNGIKKELLGKSVM